LCVSAYSLNSKFVSFEIINQIGHNLKNQHPLPRFIKCGIVEAHVVTFIIYFNNRIFGIGFDPDFIFYFLRNMIDKLIQSC